METTRQLDDRKESRTHNSIYTQGGVPSFVDSFVGVESSVLRINFSGKLPALLVASNRYRLFQD